MHMVQVLALNPNRKPGAGMVSCFRQVQPLGVSARRSVMAVLTFRCFLVLLSFQALLQVADEWVALTW